MVTQMALYIRSRLTNVYKQRARHLRYQQKERYGSQMDPEGDMATVFEIKEYTEGGHSPFAEWFNSLDAVTAARVDRYIRRLEAGNFGAAKSLQNGVFESRMDFGPGYRVYYGREGKTIIILLGGGNKRRQSTDIAAAIARWKKYKAAGN